MKAGDIVIAILPQDGLQKRRPVLILKVLPRYNDLLVCAVSSQLYQYTDGLDIILESTHPAFTESGLNRTSVFRITNIATLSQEDVEGTVGCLQHELFRNVIENLTGFLGR